MRKVLIANRGEIAVRVARACKDAGLASVAIYADQDLDALHVRAADEAYALDGSTPAQTYLDIEKIIAIARRGRSRRACTRATASWPRTPPSPQAVIEAGLTWIGPPPAAIEALGDKVRAREIAKRVGAPLAPGTDGPVSGPDEVREFARAYGLPIAIKAAFGGGGRGLKVARTEAEIGELYESAVREATAAFGNGECFVERYLDRPRHVETQCLADAHGNVVVVSTRDCSLQRRHQKLVEEAPAPFLSDAQLEQLYASSKAILREAGYVGAGTCEFLVAQDGTISFLEVNTRLQVEHPVSEEVGRPRPGAGDVPDRRWRGAWLRRPGPARALHRVPDQRRGPGAGTSCPRRARSPSGTRRRGRASGWTRATAPGRRCRRRSTR